MTEQLREQLPAVETAVDGVAELDFIKAKVEFARKFNAVVPEISADNTLELIDARHPLLEENLKRLSAISYQLSAVPEKGLQRRDAETLRSKRRWRRGQVWVARP